MDLLEKNNRYAVIAAVCYAAVCLHSVVSSIASIGKTGNSISLITLLSWIALIGICVSLFKKDKKLVLLAFGFRAVMVLVVLIKASNVGNAFSFFAYAAAVGIIALALQGNVTVTKTWFIAAAIKLVGSIISWNVLGVFTNISDNWTPILFSLIEVIALVFMGLWLKKEIAADAYLRSLHAYESASTVPRKDEFVSTASKDEFVSTASLGTNNTVEELKKFKDLLDAGAITQEEFDAKKKQLLGL